MAEPAIRLVWKKIDELIPYKHNAKLHPEEQLEKLVNSFDEFGRIVPAGIDAEGRLIYGHGRILAARQRGDTDFPCIEIDGLSENQRRAFVHADNLLSQSDTDETMLRAEMIELSSAGFDVSLTGYDPEGIRLGDDESETHFWGDVETETTEEYEAFTEKFKPKLTTDDVYTPDNIYCAVRNFAVEHYGLDGARIIRPFYPGADYKSADYPAGCVVIDNPPFSILSEICAWYDEHGVCYFLFAPGLTLYSINGGKCNYLPIGLTVMFSNGASIAVSFVTNLGPWKVEICPELYRALDEANDENLKAQHADLPVYSYPDAVLTVAANKLAKYGQTMQITATACSFTRALDAQRETGKAIYGAGFLLSEKATAEKAAAEKAAAEKAAATKWALSERELAIIAKLEDGGNG